MDYRHILHMLSPLGHVSPFDVNMAVDAGFDVVVPYTRVELKEVGPLIQDAIFSRGPKGVKATGAFIGGKNAELALDMLDCARKAMVPPFEISVFADPAGSFTTAAAMVAKVEKALAQKQGDLAGRKVVIFGGTGVVGFASAVITALQKASPVLVGYDGVERVKQLAESAKKRFGVEIGYADGSSEAANGRALADAEIVLSAPKAGIRVVTQSAARQGLEAAGRRRRQCGAALEHRGGRGAGRRQAHPRHPGARHRRARHRQCEIQGPGRPPEAHDRGSQAHLSRLPRRLRSRAPDCRLNHLPS